MKDAMQDMAFILNDIGAIPTKKSTAWRSRAIEKQERISKRWTIGQYRSAQDSQCLRVVAPGLVPINTVQRAAFLIVPVLEECFETGFICRIAKAVI